MSSDSRSEIVIELTPKKILALSLLTIVSLGAVYSYIVAIFAFEAPSQDLSMRFNSVGTFDTSNVAKGAFARGSTVRIKVQFEMADYYYWAAPAYYYYYYYYFAAGESYRLIYTVVDGSGTPVYFYSTTGSLSPAQIVNTYTDYVNLSTSAAGTYTVRVYLWSEWLPAGRALAPNIGSATFTIT